MRRTVLVALAAVLTLVAAACSGTATTTEGQALGNGIPELVVTDVDTGEQVTLASMVPADKPTLLWFWAPHCPTCRGETPELNDFAAEHGDEIAIVGVGARDDYAYAQEFIEDTGVPFAMTWDETGESWKAFEVPFQPAGVLVSADGEWLARWQGVIPLEEVLTQVSG